MHIEQVREADKPDAMRAELFRLSQYCPLIRNTMQMADYSGLSAEDRYTTMAYHALKALMVLQQQTLTAHEASTIVRL